MADDTPALWECPDCAFSYDACHVDEATGQNSCPVCELERTRIVIDAASNYVRATREAPYEWCESRLRVLAEALAALDLL